MNQLKHIPDFMERAYRVALSARFEHGESPHYGGY